jgi:hypothetical protein
MPTPFESSQLILKLFELRREPVLREARQWFVGEFTPETLEELLAIAGGERNASFRMVIGYWDMAASLVTHGGIDEQMFLDANPEIWATFAKVAPFLDEMRRISNTPQFARHLESVVLRAPGGAERIAAVREQFVARARSKRTSG